MARRDKFNPGSREPEVPSNTIAWFFREALRRIWIAKRNSFVAVLMIAISLFVLGGFLLAAENMQRAVGRWESESRVSVYLQPEATPEQVRAVDTFLASKPELRRRHFVTREQALADFKKNFTSLAGVVDHLDANPFPASFRVDVAGASLRSRGVADAVTALRAMSGVEEVELDWEWVERIRRLAGLINAAGVIAGGILAIAAAFTIANVIRLTMLLYREEIEIMRLVGATERIIRGPFLVEGFLQGTIGGIAAVALLWGSFALARQNLDAPQSLVWGFLFTTFLPWQKLAALVAGGMLAGWFGSWMSVRERVGEER